MSTEVKYSKEERLRIGQEIYEKVYTTAGAAEHYKVNPYTARDYLRLYKASINKAIPSSIKEHKTTGPSLRSVEAEFSNCSKEELIRLLARSMINEARAKKGYEVKGDGAEKEYIILSNESTK